MDKEIFKLFIHVQPRSYMYIYAYITTYTTIHINEAISFVFVRALLEYRSRMTSHNDKTNGFRALLMNKTNRFHFAVRMYC